MTELEELQQLFRDAMFGDKIALSAVGNLVRPVGGLSGEEHVRIYRQTVLGTLTRSLGNIFAVTRRLVGEQFFDAMAARYIPDAPSRSPDLADYGESFPQFIREFAPAAELPYLGDVALLEWHWHRAFHAADEPPLDSEALRAAAAEDASRIVFRLPASATLLESRFPIRRIWQINQPDYHGSDQLSLDDGGERLIVWRRLANELRIDELDDDTWQLLNGIAKGQTLEQLGDGANISLLPRCAERGWLGGFDTL